MPRQRRIGWVMHVGLLTVAGCLASIALADSAFDEQREVLSLATVTHPEAKIDAMLQAGLAEQKPTQALALTERWLRQNSAADPMLLYRAGQAADLAGDWTSAVSLYRQYLKRADVQSETASEAILAIYTLQINHLAAPEVAYAFSKVDGHRLVDNAQARQFDRWFLDEAKRRKDKDALAARLLALTEAKVGDDLLVALHEDDFRWLLNAINGDRLDQARYTADFIENVKSLSKGITFDKELALLLDWSVSVKAYNMALLAGDQAAPPLAEARALLSAYPRHAERVQTGWAGGRGRHYRGDHKTYWQLEQDAKLAPVNAAAAKLDPIAQAAYYQSYSSRYYDGGPYLVPADQAAAWVASNPELANRKVGPILSFNWHRITPEDAKKIAPLLAQNPSPEAAGIRALASVNKIAEELDKAVDNLIKQEAWRLSANELPGYIDRLWHHAGRPDGNTRRDQLIKKGKQAEAAQKISPVKKEQPANQRLKVFRELWNDYKSNQPKLIGVRPRLVQALQLTPEALPELIKDPSIEARVLMIEAMHSGRLESTAPAWAAFNSARAIYTDRYAPCFNEQARRHYGGMSRFVNNKEQYRPHPLGQTFHKLLEDQLKQNKAEPWVVFGWMNTQFPEDNDKSVALMQKLLQSPAWKGLPFEARAGARAWFKGSAMTQPQSTILAMADADLISKPLLALPEDADSATAAAALGAVLRGLKQSPVRHEVLGLGRLGKLKPEVASDPLILEELMVLGGSMRSFTTDQTLTARLFQAISKEPDAEVVHRMAPYLWRDVEVYHRSLGAMMDFSEQMVDINPSAGHAMARIGLQTIARHKRGHTYYKRDTDIPRLKAIRGRAALAMNLVEVPVPPSHPAYPIYQSQSEYLLGNIGTARQLYSANADQLLPILRQVSVPYLLWALQTTIDNREEARQEELVKALLAWVQESSTAFSVEQRIALDIAYGDIALQRGMLPEAQQIFARTRSNEAYAASFERHQASLRLVRVQRIAKDFDAALQTLMELDSEKVPRLTTEAHFARAEVFYDMEEYEDSADEIAEVLDRDPEHSDATILRGRVQLRLQKLIEATEVELGSTTKQPSLVPGQMLKVTLNDPTLSVSSGATDIEVVVWATSGDKEYLLLRQFGDQKTKYRGDVRTALGQPSPEDGMLQIVGDDEVYYAYSERFREKMVNLDENRGGPIQVASDAMLMASARKLLSENEQRVADMQRLTTMLRQNEDQEALKRSNPERYAAIQAEAERHNRQAMLEARVKPGNPIHLRVIDPDRGRTSEIDELPVSVSSSSGDLIGRVVLQETGTHTGTFEGKITTTAAQAMAFATSSESGRNPNMVISPKADYPAWRPVVSEDAEHHLTIDLNDNVELGQMVISASDAGTTLKSFVVQTGMNANDMTPVAMYPKNLIAIEKPWHPSVVVMNDTDFHHNRNDRSVYDFSEIQAHMARGWMSQQFIQAVADNVAGVSDAFTPEIPGRVKWKRNNHHNHSHVIYRFRGYFYEPAPVTRRFKLDLGKFKMPEVHPSVAHPAQYLLAVNGRPITSAETPDKLEGSIDLNPGLHRFEIWATGWDGRIGFGRSAKLFANLNDEEALVDVPDSFFDPAAIPEGVLGHRNTPGTISAAESGESFEVDFAAGSRGRLIRLVFVDQDGPVPSINRITLTKPGGELVLPVAEDFAELRKNDVLEIITGDQVAVRYLDDRFVTQGQERHERLLNVAFTDATIEFADIDPRIQRGAMRDYHEQLLRFAYDTPLPVIVNDADMDETTEADTLTVLVTNDKGQTKELTATETGPSTGTFRAWITPVDQATQAADEIHISKGGTLSATYMDQENLKPGVPYERIASIEHASFSVPKIEIAHAALEPFVPDPDRGELVRALNESQESPYWARTQGREQPNGDRIKTRYLIAQRYLGMDEAPEGGLAVVHGRMALVDIVAPHLALGENAAIEVFVQTDSGRQRSAQSGGAFNVNVPGTLVYTGTLNAGDFRSETMERGGYLATFAETRGNDYERARQSKAEGRFRLAVPLITGLTPTKSFADREAFREASRDTGERYPYGLVAKAGERIHIGVKYQDDSGKTQWSTASAKVIAMPMLDVMQEDYRESLTEGYVGERLFVRVVDPYEDRTPERDQVRVFMQTKSGQRHFATLTETDFNSGIFKGSFQLTFAEAAEQAGEEGYDVGRMGMPVTYGDAVGIRYTDAKDRKTPAYFLNVAKGSDGTIAPFSKQYDDAETAMETQFAMAESFLELARRHRKLEKEEAAQREFQRARQLLANTVAQFNDPQTRSHAEYLLGNLTMEDAEATEDKALQADRYQAALARYMKVTGSYGETEWAAKAQFKTAVIYERLGEPDIAAQEYVKLAYKYPDSEHLATSMARLGTHFQRKAVQYERQAKPLLEDEENKDDFFEGTALKKLSQLEYTKAGQIFERLQERFPSHELAGTAGLRAGQIYMRAEDLPAAIKALQSVYNDENYDGPTLRCEAMYWAGRCHVMMRQELLAYSLFKRITYDFPESKWAAYARGQLSSERMLNLDKQLEIERLEAGQ